MRDPEIGARYAPPVLEQPRSVITPYKRPAARDDGSQETAACIRASTSVVKWSWRSELLCLLSSCTAVLQIRSPHWGMRGWMCLCFYFIACAVVATVGAELFWKQPCDNAVLTGYKLASMLGAHGATVLITATVEVNHVMILLGVWGLVNGLVCSVGLVCEVWDVHQARAAEVRLKPSQESLGDGWLLALVLVCIGMTWCMLCNLFDMFVDRRRERPPPPSILWLFEFAFYCGMTVMVLALHALAHVVKDTRGWPTRACMILNCVMIACALGMLVWWAWRPDDDERWRWFGLIGVVMSRNAGFAALLTSTGIFNSRRV
eukprot:TRINITY_DN33855_c0_g1_i2.p1 TRINITY_DN33855_c0_g1~~TRINITY_DN33855_c0_g1_i2.p1  ORF type:complete len:318 (-),score=28.94 TRINITY_DN33855_c0_g1_i2:31-984(-)